ncbi:MAG TPA: PP2C family protein-serine/threonine phosphatase [Kiritimatiellia bacterium]|nr:PP2C family protein-serine/threonine phosphatase [Kiritimatiellia bacterium]
MQTGVPLFTGITRGRWTGIILVSLVILILFVFLYANARRSVINEIRHQAMGVAVAVAAAIPAEEIDPIRVPSDENLPEYQRIQKFLSRVEVSNPDIRYVYTMRQSLADGAKPSDYEFVVDAAPRDINGNGMLDRAERSEPVGRAYDAADLPEMVAAWYNPSADPSVSPDPPYPDLLSGYAPIKNALGQTVAIVGVDITAATVRVKLFALRGVIILVWFVLTLLVMLVVQLYYQQQEALDRNRALSSELASRNEMLHAANIQLSHNNEQFKQELKLAQSVQLGFLPKKFPRQDKILFDKYYLTCEMLGGDLFDVFTLDDDHVGMYVADVAGHGASAALVSGLLKMAVNSVREYHSVSTSFLQASLLQPEMVLAQLNDMLIKEIPDYEFITMVYAVLTLPTYRFTVASAGHLSPLQFQSRTGEVLNWNLPTGPALGLMAGSIYPVIERPVMGGDKILFYTDGLTEAMNAQNEQFTEERLVQIFKKCGPGTPSDITQALVGAIQKHRGEHIVTDDFSILVAEIR